MSVSMIFQLVWYEVLDTVPFVVLAVIPFRTRIRSQTMVVLFSAALYLMGFIRRIFSMSFPPMAAVLSFLWAAMYLISYRCSVRERLPKLLFVLLIVLNYASMAAICYNFIGSRLFSVRFQQNPYGFEAVVSIILVLAVTYPVMICWLVHTLTPLLIEQENSEAWNTLWLAPAIFCMIFYYNLYTSGSIFEFSSSIKNVLFSFLISAGSFFVLSINLKLVRVNARMLHLQSENHQLEMHMLQFQYLSEQVEQARQARHDLRQFVNVLQVYLKSGDTETVHSYIEKICSAVPDVSPLVYCHHTSLNALLCYYAALFAKKEIEFSVQIAFSDQTRMEDTDVVVLFGNLLENAFEACGRKKSGNRFISLRVETIGGQIIILINNSFEGKLKQEEGCFLSSKRTGYGIGLASVRRITLKYQGTVKFDHDGNVFCVSVRLNDGQPSL